MIPQPLSRAVLSVLLCATMIGCSRRPEESVRIADVDFLPAGICVGLNREADVEQVSVLDAQGAQLRAMNVAAKRQQRFTLYLSWQGGLSYTVQVRLRDGTTLSRQVTAPQKPPYLADLRLRVPYGAGTPQNASSIVSAGARVRGGIDVESFVNAPVDFEIRLTVPEAIGLQCVQPEWDVKEERDRLIARTKGSVRIGFERWCALFDLQLPPEVTEDYDILVLGRFATPDGKTWETQRRSTLRALLPSEAASLLRVVSIDMPTDAEGAFDPARRPNHIVLPNEVARRIRRLLGLGLDFVDAHEPAAYQTIRLQNRAEQAVALMLSADILDPKTGREVPAFAASPHISPGGIPLTLALVSVPAGATSDVVLPIFIDPAKLLPGEYVRKVDAKLLGTDARVVQVSAPLFVIRRNVVAICVTLITCVVSVVALLLFIILQRRVFARFSIRSLILIALFATTAFVAVGLPLTVVTNVVSALLGPFAFVVTGVFAEVVYFLLLTALVVLIPRVGTIALATLVRYLLRAVMMGGLSPMDILFVGTAILLKELAFFACGLTRRGGRVMSGYPERKRSIACAAGLAIGAAQALSLFVSLCLLACLYRLYFAYWYIVAYVTINGVLYTFAGVTLGLRLGHSLRKITD